MTFKGTEQSQAGLRQSGSTITRFPSLPFHAGLGKPRTLSRLAFQCLVLSASARPERRMETELPSALDLGPHPRRLSHLPLRTSPVCSHVSFKFLHFWWLFMFFSLNVAHTSWLCRDKSLSLNILSADQRGRTPSPLTSTRKGQSRLLRTQQC